MTTTAEKNILRTQVAHTHETYMESADGLPVQDDLDDRVALSQESKDPLDDDTWNDDINATAVDLPNVKTRVYDGGNIVTYAGEGTRTQVEAIVATAIAADDLFVTGPGFEDPVGTNNSPYHDPLFLIEASKLTGEKYY